MNFKNTTYQLIADCEKKAQPIFKEIDEIAFQNQKKVLEAFQNNKVATRHFSGTNGYGYDDIGRDTLNKVFADIFHTEDALVSPNIVSGTHALTLMYFGLLRPNDNFMCISGTPYDTLKGVISGKNNGSLKEFGVNFETVELLKNGDFDKPTIESKIKSKKIKLISIQRSRGYEWRDALSIDQIGDIVKFVKKLDKDIIIVMDNCYGEFIDPIEPTDVGVDIIAGSLIKNPGGGLAPTGGYIAGKKDLVELISYRLTAPSIGNEVGSYASGYRAFYQGLFFAPKVTANAVKTSVLFGFVFEALGYETLPAPTAKNNDIIRSIKFDTAEELIKFIQAIQYASPIDSYVTPIPWAMPGYEDEVIMAAGTFVAGASIELSADSPIKAPYIAYAQGGLTYEHGKLAVMMCVENLDK